MHFGAGALIAPAFFVGSGVAFERCLKSESGVPFAIDSRDRAIMH